jgi:putative heme-binding domain-containing protein
VGLAWTPEGDLIVSGTFFQHPGDGKRDGLIHAVRGGVWGKDHDVLEGHIRTGPLMPPMTHLGPAAPCGICRYGRDLLLCQFNMRKVSRHVLEPEGATWKTTDSDFLASDHPDFHPTDVLQAPDGSVLVIDTGGWYKICCPTSQIARPEVPGAIYRLRKTGGEVSTVCPAPRWKLELPPEPAALLEQAKTGDIKAREKLVATVIPPLGAQAKSKNLHVRRLAIEALGQWPARHHFSHGGDMHELTLESRAIVAPLLEAAALPGTDRFLEHAVTFALMEGADAREPREAFRSKLPALQRIGLYWVSQTDPVMFDDPANIGKFLLSADAGVREAAVFCLQKVPAWREPAAAQIRKELAAGENPNLRPAVEALMVSSDFRKDIGSLVSATRPGPSQNMLLGVMAEAASRYGFQREWADPLLSVLDGGNAETGELAARVLATKPPKKMEALRGKLLERVHDANRSPSVRVTLMSALSPLTPDEPGFALLLQVLESSGPLADTAARVLQSSTLNTAQLTALAGRLANCGLLRRPVVLHAFRDAADETLGLAVMDQLEKSGGLSGMSLQDLQECLGKFPDKIQQRLSAARSKLNPGAEQQRARIDELEKTLPTGEVRRGAVVFQSAKASCVLCHQAGYFGRHIGPDLSKIGGVRTRRDLLEAIAFPSASFVRSYEPVELKRKDGTLAYGILRSQSPQSVTLITGAVTPDVTVAVADIASLNPGTLSLMPQGIDQILTPQELADLIAFLQSLK